MRSGKRSVSILEAPVFIEKEKPGRGKSKLMNGADIPTL